MPILHQFPQKIKQGDTSQVIYEKNYKKRKLQTNIPHEYRCKNPQLNISNSNQAIYKRIIHYYEEQDVDKLENLDKMDEFLENITYPNSFDKGWKPKN